MVSVLWLVPLAVAGCAVWPLLAATRRVNAELAAFCASVDALSELVPAVTAIRDDADRSRRMLEKMTLR